MRCRYCGAEIPEGILYCEECGGEVQIVPDYNPLEDILAEHVKDALRKSGRTSGGGVRSRANAEYKSGRTAALRSESGRMPGNRTGYVANSRTAALRSGSGRMTAGRTGYMTDERSGRYRGGTGVLPQEREAQRRQAERRRAQKKKKRRKVLLILLLLLAVIAALLTAVYINSYAGVVFLGNRALRNGEYTKAEDYFRRAVDKNKEKAEAYAGLSKVYIGQNDISAAENLFLNVIDEQPENAAVYEAAFEFYLDTKQPMGIPKLLKDAKPGVTKELSDYVVGEPEFSLNEEETFDDVQQLTLTSKEGEVRYTTNGSMPDTKSMVFTEPIQLGEGSNTIKAIVVNKEGIPSQTAEKEFVIEIPIEDAPAVSPSTGQYDSARSIEIKVPEGYTAYYTMDGTDPTTASIPYKEPVEMPEGETLFKAILVTKSGRVSGITTRNYVRE